MKLHMILRAIPAGRRQPPAGLVSGLGVYIWLMSAFAVIPGQAYGDDLDIYTKATAVSAGAPMVAMVTDTSADMAASLLSANGSTATTLLHERSANMQDALRAVMTSGAANLNITLLDYAAVADTANDNGRIVHEMATVGGTLTSTPPVVTVFSGTLDQRIADGADDVILPDGGSQYAGGTSITLPVRPAAPPTSIGGEVAGTWTSGGGSGLGGTPADGVADAVTDASFWRNSPGNGNQVFIYKHTSALDLTQTFRLDRESGTANPVLFLVDYFGLGTPVLLSFNDDRSSYYECKDPAYPFLQTPLIGTPQCYKKSNFTGQKINATLAVITNSTVSAVGLVSGRYYRVVAATRTAGESGTFKLTVADTAKGTFFDSDTGVPLADQRAGFFFDGIQIPRGASISSARLIFKRTSSGGDDTDVIVGIDQDRTPDEFAARALTARTWAEDSDQTLDVDATNPELEITDLLEDHVNHSDWCPGNSLALQVRRDPTELLTEDYLVLPSYEGSPLNGARLVVEYDEDSGDPNACDAARTVTLKVSAMSEDVNQFADGMMDLHKDFIPSGTQATCPANSTDAGCRRTRLLLGGGNKVGLRFTLAQIPPGATIVSAKLRLTAVDTTGAQPLKVAGILDKSGNAQAFFGDTRHLDTLQVTGQEIWTPVSWQAGQVYESPNLASLVQQQVNNTGWHSESTLGFLLEGSSTSAVVAACAYERGPGGGYASVTRSDFGSCAAELVLEIDDNGAAVTTTYRRSLVNALMNLKKTGRQPMGGAYLKTAQYLAGWFGTVGTISSDAIADHGRVDTAPYVKPALATGGCASNNIVFISDVNEGARYPANFGTQYGNFATALGKTISCSTSGSNANQSSLNCNRALAEMLYEGFVPVGGTEEATITTFTFNFNATAGGAGGADGAVDLTTSDSGGGNLRSIAESGGGAFKQSGSSAQLVKQLLTVLRSIADSGASVAAPGISVNALNRFEHLDQLYYSLFKPSVRVDWTGNLKRYQLKNSEVADINGNVAVTLANNAFFDTNARSFWSPGKDGSTVTIGGAAQKTAAAERRLYTFVGSNASKRVPLTSHTVTRDNPDLDEYTLGIKDPATDTFLVPSSELLTQMQIDARRDQIIDFLTATPKSDTTVLWAASIHNSPRIVSFKNDAADPVITVFYGDNRGLLHAVDAGGLTSDDPNVNLQMAADANPAGKELFAYIPQELLKNAARFHDNTRSVISDGYIYGMDGDITLYRKDEDFDGNLEQVLVFAGMRRGGSNYYALDVSKARKDVPPDERIPTLQWVIEGGVGNYAEMGQTWSAMSPNRIFWNGTRRDVLVFGGGYDPAAHDDLSYANTQGVGFSNTLHKGAVVYIADPADGSLIWKSTQLNSSDPNFAAIANMRYSIVATPRLIDRNGDGAYDGMYVVDLAGQVFRFDFNKGATSADNLMSRVSLIAKLGATGERMDLTSLGAEAAPGSTAVSPADNRRFYDPPSVAYMGTDVLIALSSGYREEPTSDATQEAFFFIRDKGAFSATPRVNPTLQLSNLDNISATAVSEGADPTALGWYYRFEKDDVGEKGIGSPVIFNSAILWSTYLVEEVNDPCVPDIGQTRLYLVDFLGRGLADADGDGAGTDRSRSVDIELPGLADTPQVIFREGGGIDVAVGVRVNAGEDLCVAGVNCPFETSAFGTLRRSRWYMVDED